MKVNALGIRRVTIADGTEYELASFEMSQFSDRARRHYVTASTFDRENQFLFEVVALPCLHDEIAATRARTEGHAEGRLGSHTWSPGDRDCLEPATPVGV
jgi:hypothetical protein